MKEDEDRVMSVDMVLSRANGRAGQWSRRHYCWVDVNWTRGDYEDGELEVVGEAWRKVDDLQKVINWLGNGD